MRIRNARDYDKSSVLKFCESTFSWGDYISDVWDVWNSKGKLFVAEEDGRIVGVYNLAIYEKQTWVEGMRVDPQYRRRKIGSSMLAHAESVVTSAIMRLIIESENHPSIRLVESMGYILEDKWRLYSMAPRKERSTVRNAVDLAELKPLIASATYADSWKWLPLEMQELGALMQQKRVIVSDTGGTISAIGIWNRSVDFHQTMQLGYVNGTADGILDILKFIQNKALEMQCEKIQVFAQEKTSLDMNFLDKRSLFYLMRKDREKPVVIK